MIGSLPAEQRPHVPQLTATTSASSMQASSSQLLAEVTDNARAREVIPARAREVIPARAREVIPARVGVEGNLHVQITYKHTHAINFHRCLCSIT